jgi:ribosomal protein S18 acetylase RimI-like enzyme
MITQLEELSMDAWPSLQTMMYDGWVLRFSDGYTKRANSSNPLYRGVLKVEEKIDRCEKLYSEGRLDTVFKLTTASQPPGLDGILETRGYSLESASSVQTLDLDAMVGQSEPGLVLSSEVSDEWFSAFGLMSGLDQRTGLTAKRMLLSIVPKKCLASASSGGKIVACGMAVLQGEYVGLFDIVTHKEFRRLGYGKRLTLGLLHWAKGNGAKVAYLQVLLSNEAALPLYSSLGFAEAYQYWYRVKKLGSPHRQIQSI